MSNRPVPVPSRVWNHLFYAVAAIVFCVMAFTATKVGVTGDEFLDQRHGEFCLKYYTEHDTTFADYRNDTVLRAFPHMKYYGAGYEIVPAVAVKYFNLPESRLFLFRHLLCAFFGFLLIFFTGLTAKKLTKSTGGGIITLLTMSCTPAIFGLSFYATKDIPFAAGFAIACYAFIAIFQGLPKFKVWHIMLAIYGIALAVSVRIGGLMLPLYLIVLFALYLLFDKAKRQMFFEKPYTLLLKSLGVGVLVVALGSLLGLCFYPNFFYEGPIEHIKNALTVVSKFPQRIPMTFEGRQIDSLSLPDNYLVKSFFYTVPLFVFAFVALFLANIVRIWKKYDMAAILFLVFTFLFPVILVLTMESNVYNGWRHETFAYYGLAVVASIGAYETFNWFSTTKLGNVWRWLAPSLIVASMMPTMVWMARNYKYTYSYYNVLAGDPYLRYDLDYYETSQTILLDWLVKNELKDRNDTVRITSKNENAVEYQKRRKYDNIIVEKHGYKAFAEADADYSILSTHFMAKKYVKKFFPPVGTIKVETVNGKPIAAVVKRDKLDSKGIKLVQQGKYQEGMDLLDSAYSKNPDNFGIFFWMGYGYFYTKEYEKSIEFFNKAKEYDLSESQNVAVWMFSGVANYELGKNDEAIRLLKTAESIAKDENQRYYIRSNLALAYFKDEKFKEAASYFEQVISKYPYFQGNLNYCYLKMGRQSR